MSTQNVTPATAEEVTDRIRRRILAQILTAAQAGAPIDAVEAGRRALADSLADAEAMNALTDNIETAMRAHYCAVALDLTAEATARAARRRHGTSA